MKIRANFEDEFGKSVESLSYQLELPARGQTSQEVIHDAKLHLDTGDLDWANGAMSGCMYNSSKELGDLAADVYRLAAWTNPLHPDAFPGKDHSIGLSNWKAAEAGLTCQKFVFYFKNTLMVTTSSTVHKGQV